MKRYIFCLLCIIITSLCVHSQESIGNPDLTSYEYSINKPHYKDTPEWKNYKTLRAVGWSALGVGVPMTLTGIIGIGLSVINGGNGAPWTVVTAVGGSLAISSVPLLITAYHYRHKAKKMSLNVGVTSISNPYISNRMDYTPAVSFALNF